MKTPPKWFVEKAKEYSKGVSTIKTEEYMYCLGFQAAWQVFAERIEGTEEKDPASASPKDPQELYNAGRESLRRELLED